MFIKMFKEQQVRIQDPLRPSKRIFEMRLNPAGATSYAGHEADAEGWIEVPDEVGEAAVGFRGPNGERFFTPGQVDEEVVGGRIKPEAVDATPRRAVKK